MTAHTFTMPADAADFETHRPWLFALAYRMLGSATEAEDILQEAYLRWQAAGPGTIHSPQAFLRTVVTRLCLNQLQSARAQRETYLGPWLPEPILTDSDERADPQRQAELHDSISFAFLALLEALTPLERAVYLLREVFDYDYAEIAAMLNKDETACRQVFSRARAHVAAGRPRFTATPEAHRRLLSQFIAAVGSGEVGALAQLLTDDVILWADGGGKARGAATRPLHGPEAVSQFVLGSTRLLPPGAEIDLAAVNGELAMIARVAGRAVLVVSLAADGERVSAIRVVGNPDKLHWVSQPPGAP